MVKHTTTPYIVLACMVLALSVSVPKQVQALELGLTPSHVFGIWLNINTVALEIQKSSKLKPTKLPGAKSLVPKIFSNKKPEDVFARANLVQKKLILTLGIETLPKTPQWILDYQVLEGEAGKKEVTPSQVFVLSSNILHALVKKYSEVNNHSQPISQYYKDNKILGKTPSDVFGLVDLLSRRLDALNVNPAGGS
ncbi:MAG: hypothetical protein JKY92_07890 [Magnetovibrio sp.]|nr:hypothetical protein [Magnetovibrio sp.]